MWNVIAPSESVVMTAMEEADVPVALDSVEIKKPSIGVIKLTCDAPLPWFRGICNTATDGTADWWLNTMKYYRTRDISADSDYGDNHSGTGWSFSLSLSDSQNSTTFLPSRIGSGDWADYSVDTGEFSQHLGINPDIANRTSSGSWNVNSSWGCPMFDGGTVNPGDAATWNSTDFPDFYISSISGTRSVTQLSFSSTFKETGFSDSHFTFSETHGSAYTPGSDLQDFYDYLQTQNISGEWASHYPFSLVVKGGAICRWPYHYQSLTSTIGRSTGGWNASQYGSEITLSTDVDPYTSDSNYHFDGVFRNIGGVYAASASITNGYTIQTTNGLGSFARGSGDGTIIWERGQIKSFSVVPIEYTIVEISDVIVGSSTSNSTVRFYRIVENGIMEFEDVLEIPAPSKSPSSFPFIATADDSTVGAVGWIDVVVCFNGTIGQAIGIEPSLAKYISSW